MGKRRTHSSIDKLPKDLRDIITAMVVDHAWPSDYPGKDPEYNGNPRYEDIVAYCLHCGHKISLSAVGRWAKRLVVFERMKTAGAIARDVMTGLTDDQASKTQKAAAEIITAQIIELAASSEMSAKDIKSLATAVRDCTSVAMKADTYMRDQAKEKAKAVAASAGKKLKAAGVDRKKAQELIDDILGITKQ